MSPRRNFLIGNNYMIEVMDLDLWHLSDSIGNESDAGYGQCEFNFRYVPDVIEEHATNEKSCVEVLNHMIAKADTEILDLEDDLAMLQSQLSWSEHEKLFEVFISAFREKITSLNLSLQTLRKGYTHSSNALNADSGTHHEPVERIRDTITALLDNYNSTESNKDSVVVKADIEEKENATSVTSLGLSRKPDNKLIVDSENSRKPDNKLIVDSENQVADSEIKGESNAVQRGIAVNGSEAIILSQQDCETKGGTELCTLSTSRAIILWQQDCDVKVETEQRSPGASLQRGVKVDFDENEPPAILLYTPASKRRKVENKTRSRTEIAKKSNQTFCVNGMSVATSHSRLSLASEVGGRNTDLGKKNSAAKIHPLHTKKDPAPSSYGSQLALSPEMSSPSMSTHSRDMQVVKKYGPLEKLGRETAVSDCTREKLEKMNRADLLAVAKKYGVKKYYKTKKSLLVDMILSTIDEVVWTPCTE